MLENGALVSDGVVATVASHFPEKCCCQHEKCMIFRRKQWCHKMYPLWVENSEASDTGAIKRSVCGVLAERQCICTVWSTRDLEKGQQAYMGFVVLADGQEALTEVELVALEKALSVGGKRAECIWPGKCCLDWASGLLDVAEAEVSDCMETEEAWRIVQWLQNTVVDATVASVMLETYGDEFGVAVQEESEESENDR